MHTRWALIVFAAVAFFYIATWFFWILTHMNWVLYPPKEYGGETGVTTYVDAMTSYRISGRHVSQATGDSPKMIEEIYASHSLIWMPITR